MAKKKENNEHISQTPFANMLSQFVGADNDSLATPYKSQDMSISPALLQDVHRQQRNAEKDSEECSSLIDIDDRPLTDLDDLNDDEFDANDPIESYNPNFDEIIEQAFVEDEDITMRNNLIAMGRKYAVKGAEDDGASEVSRTFAKQERALDRFIEDVGSDESKIEQDIEHLRASRTKSYKSLADLVSAKVSMRNIKLAAIKEQSTVKKTIYDINIKLKKDKSNDSLDGNTTATQAVQRVFSMGRKSLIANCDDSQETYANDSNDDGRAETAIADTKDIPEAITDGEKFIKYESLHPELVVDIDSESGMKQVYAVSSDGDIIPDYPLPSNIEELHFDINEISGEATDQLQRRYRVKRNGEYINDEDYS